LYTGRLANKCKSAHAFAHYAALNLDAYVSGLKLVGFVLMHKDMLVAG
jgi:hypothetical protein